MTPTAPVIQSGFGLLIPLWIRQISKMFILNDEHKWYPQYIYVGSVLFTMGGNHCSLALFLPRTEPYHQSKLYANCQLFLTIVVLREVYLCKGLLWAKKKWTPKRMLYVSKGKYSVMWHIFLCKVLSREWNIIQWNAFTWLPSLRLFSVSLSLSLCVSIRTSFSCAEWMLYNSQSIQLCSNWGQRVFKGERQRDLRSPVQRKKIRWVHAEKDLL